MQREIVIKSKKLQKKIKFLQKARKKMKNIILLLVLVVFGNCGQNLTKEEIQANKFIMRYYKNPAPQKIQKYFGIMSKSGYISRKNSYTPMMGFLSGVLKSDKKNADKIVRQLDDILPKKEKMLIVDSMMYGGMSDKKIDIYLKNNESLRKIYEHRKGKAKSLFDIPMQKGGPALLDAFWGYFMASGDQRAIEKIVSTLKWVEAKNNENHTYKLRTALAAKWSLTSNAIQDKTVYKIIKNQLKTQPKNIQVQLKEIIKEADKK